MGQLEPVIKRLKRVEHTLARLLNPRADPKPLVIFKCKR
jgi:hypothetical protein